jgi:hypothetical protein
MRPLAFGFAIVTAMVCLVPASGAEADTLRTFDVSGLFRSGAVMSGTLTIDSGHLVSTTTASASRQRLS